ncbi:MAG: DUF222 domain-containing protein [Longimicrobiales bacterium]|nr:DUF222 domain-containing protein [Longimicrobiales bacterium]
MVQFAPRVLSLHSDEESDAIETLGDEIATLAAHIHAAAHRLLVLLAEFDRRQGWEREGHNSCAHWLAFRTGIDLGSAREKVRAARALLGLPKTSAAMSRGELSFSQVRALTRVADADSEGDLLDLARGCTTAQLERVVRGWKRGSREDEAVLERERHESRAFSVFPDDEGMYVVRGKLPPEVGALLMRAVEAAGDALYRDEAGVERLAGGSPPSDMLRAAAQRRADALGLLAERAMEAGFGAAPISGTRAARYQVVLHVDAETLRADGETPAGTLGAAASPTTDADGSGRSELEDGTRVACETSRRISCDAGLVRITHARDGPVLDVGRRTRTIPPALRRALEARDRGCRFPGCGSRFTDAHHVKHWADGGETSLGNVLLACRHHHALLHEGGWRVMWSREGLPIFVDPRGGTHYDGRWKAPELPEDPVRALVEENRRRGVEPDWRTAGARWKREDDIPSDVYFRALEAAG